MAKMFRAFFFKSLFFFWYRFLLRQLKNLLGFHRSTGANAFPSHFRYQRYHSLAHRSDLTDHTLIFDVEGALLKSSSLFPYFMLVAFEAGGLIRAFIFILLYPFVCFAGPETGLNIMVMICFFGIKAKSFRAGSAVLPKFLLENVGSEIFEILNRGGKKVGVSNLPQVMVESFLREYLEIDFVMGRELKVFCGYYVGLMEDRKIAASYALNQVREGKGRPDAIGICSFDKSLDSELLTHCKEVYLVTEAEKRSWKTLAREKYPKALIFHDGRLAMRPTPVNAVATLIWFPYGLILAIIRMLIALSLPYHISTPLLAITGLRLTTSMPSACNKDDDGQCSKGNRHRLYVCNHRTLLDPLYLSFALRRDLIAVTYSLSRMSEILAPIKTVRLTRDRVEDARMMKKLLKQGDLAVCPEGTTCREPYLLRFSPLFSEMSDEITPVAVDCHVSMFHGTTAGGLKCLDPLLFLMNPSPIYSVRLLDKVSPSSTARDRFEVANHIQSQIGEALGFECTMLTRKDKYLILAGNDGLVSSTTNAKS
ncbi:LOW QUALITY PROTEIN: probable glycerol-3-phosphate acyltransferase 3 [Neltuma alba]|uniref:LOW QUALITY PROTEIN: probable glycerol-3-phosphate acyltransferase 3 n=1 Tax=Neltuma alba TaxID=207710 RepID=UPI0010A3F157|nr:LOW QUALITY PROTEIN: probable glycerol-3-phosphate acyltransferase 3 [Prosopis alba]